MSDLENSLNIEEKDNAVPSDPVEPTQDARAGEEPVEEEGQKADESLEKEDEKDTSPEAEEELGEDEVPDEGEAFYDDLRNQLSNADSDRWSSMVDTFESGEAVSDDDLQWMSEVIGYPKAACKLFTQLQQEQYLARQDKTLNEQRQKLSELDINLGDGSGDGQALVDLAAYGFANGSPEQVARWEAGIKYGQVTRNDDLITEMLEEIRDFKAGKADQSTAKKSTTPNHLLQGSKPVEEVKESVPEVENEPDKPVVPSHRGIPLDESLVNSLSVMGNSALAQMALDNSVEERVKLHADYILTKRYSNLG